MRLVENNQRGMGIKQFKTMKRWLPLLILLIETLHLQAQHDSVSAEAPASINAEYVQNIFNPYTHSANTSYNYSNKWDLDGDLKNDSVFFIGNGGAHAYYFLRIVLTSDYQIKNYPTIQLDMPYFESKDVLDKYGKSPGVQLVVNDFDGDGISDLYLNFNNGFSSIPQEWKNIGISSNYIIIGFPGNKLKVRNY